LHIVYLKFDIRWDINGPNRAQVYTIDFNFAIFVSNVDGLDTSPCVLV
jgi:hypothetical protein